MPCLQAVPLTNVPRSRARVQVMQMNVLVHASSTQGRGSTTGVTGQNGMATGAFFISRVGVHHPHALTAPGKGRRRDGRRPKEEYGRVIHPGEKERGRPDDGTPAAFPPTLLNPKKAAGERERASGPARRVRCAAWAGGPAGQRRSQRAVFHEPSRPAGMAGKEGRPTFQTSMARTAEGGIEQSSP